MTGRKVKTCGDEPCRFDCGEGGRDMGYQWGPCLDATVTYCDTAGASDDLPNVPHTDGSREAIPARFDPLSTQVGGDHYKKGGIQSVEYIHANGLSFLEGCIVKRITRWRYKDGLQDLLKIKQEIDLIIHLEKLSA